MKQSRRLLVVLIGLTGGVFVGLTDPVLGPAWGGIYGVVAAAFAGKMIFG
jgi:hypothetical protein